MAYGFQGIHTCQLDTSNDWLKVAQQDSVIINMLRQVY